MYKKTLTYPDLDGNMITEDFYFNLSKAELTEMELVEKDGMQAKLRRIIESDNRPEIIGLFKDIIRRSYGVRSSDGKSFIKNDALADAFMGTEAYSILFVSFFENATNATEFINGIVPAEMAAEMAKLEAQQADPEEAKTYTTAQLIEMPRDEFDRLFGTDPVKWPQQVLQAAFMRKTSNPS